MFAVLFFSRRQVQERMRYKNPILHMQNMLNFFGLHGQHKSQYLLVQNSQANKTQLSFHITTFQRLVRGNWGVHWLEIVISEVQTISHRLIEA